MSNISLNCTYIYVCTERTRKTHVYPNMVHNSEEMWQKPCARFNILQLFMTNKLMIDSIIMKYHYCMYNFTANFSKVKRQKTKRISILCREFLGIIVRIWTWVVLPLLWSQCYYSKAKYIILSYNHIINHRFPWT